MLIALQWILGLGGLVLLAFGLLWDRPGWRGRASLRCRKCWFDLTGTPGVRDLATFGAVLADGGGSERAVVCSECGTKHRSVRSMRRVRRKRFVALAGCGLVVGAYLWSVWHRQSGVGWIGLVPTPALIVSMKFVSDSPGDLQPHGQSKSSLPYPQRPVEELICHQVKTRLYDPDRCTRLDRLLMRWVAGSESVETLTEPTSYRGEAYRYVYDALHRQDRLGVDEKRWSERQIRMDLRPLDHQIHHQAWYARPRFRFLVNSQPTRVRLFGEMFSLRRDEWQRRGGRRNADPDGWLHPHRAEVDRYMGPGWDGLIASRANFIDNGVYFGFPNGIPRRFDGRVFAGDSEADIWWPIMDLEETAEIRRLSWTRRNAVNPHPAAAHFREIAETVPGFEIIQQPMPYVEWLEKYATVDLRWEETPDGGERPAGFMVRVQPDARKRWVMEARGDPVVPAFTFGGCGSLVVLAEPNDEKGVTRLINGKPPPPEYKTLLESNGAWWALRDRTNDEKEREFVERGMAPFREDERRRFDWPNAENGGRITEAWIVLYMGSSLMGSDAFRPLVDPEGERFLSEPIVLPLSGRSVARLREYAETQTRFWSH